TPFEQLAEGPSDAFRLAGALRGGRMPLSPFAAKPPRVALEQSGLRVKELELTSVAGEPVYVATESPEQSRLVPVHFDPAPFLDQEVTGGVIGQAIEPLKIVEARLVFDYEAYYLDRHHELPLPVLFVRVNDPDNSTYYIDPRTARIVQAYSARSRWNR